MALTFSKSFRRNLRSSERRVRKIGMYKEWRKIGMYKEWRKIGMYKE